MPTLNILLFLLFVIFSSLHTPTPCSAASGNDALTVGQSLVVGDKLISRNGKFALGFFQPGPAIISKYIDINITTSPGWYLGIWFNKIPIFTVVWVANRDRPINNPKLNLILLKILGDGNLVILNHATESIIWSTHIINKTQTNILNTTAVLLNNGNFALTGSPSNAIPPLWQSFDYPTDVFLPGAKFSRNKITGLNRQYISNKNLIDPGLGSYCIELDTNGAMLLMSRNPSVVYWSWSSGSSLSPKLIPLLKAMLDMNPHTKGLINPAYIDNNEEEYYTYTLLNESSSVFALLDISGQIKLNVWSQASQSWQTLYAQPAVPCTAYATCGPFTVCNSNSNPFCDCMKSFSKQSTQDWDLGDHTGGCVRNTPLDCNIKENTISSTDMFQPITHVTLPYDPQSIEDATTESKCAQACLNDCSCTAYSYNSSRCSIWHGELLNVKQNDDIDSTSEDVLYLRLGAKDLQSATKRKGKPMVGVVGAASVISFGLLIMLMLLSVIWRNKSKCCSAQLYSNPVTGDGIVAFRYTDLSHATKNFSEILGTGGFGAVFRGVLSDLTTIAVKRLDGARQGEKQFRAEVSSIGLIQHISLVKLIGFCSEGDKRLLVYEHMLNGSLDAHLFQSNANILNWSTRYQIAIGVARGLSYLHQSCCECIIHCDIKPENILLDALFVPKISDFGMATFVGRDFSKILTTSRGTIGYLAPEWLSGVAITPKVDVYSFGMVLLEIISGRRNSTNQVCTSSRYHVDFFPVRAVSKLHEGDVQSLVDPQLHGDFILEEAERFCKVACWCIQDNECDRPTMSEVVRALEGLQKTDMPPMPRLLAAITEVLDTPIEFQCSNL